MLFQPLLHHGHGIGEKQAVFAARDTYHDIVIILDKLEFGNSPHELAKIKLWKLKFHIKVLSCGVNIPFYYIFFGKNNKNNDILVLFIHFCVMSVEECTKKA